jgi:hypothetical protein
VELGIPELHALEGESIEVPIWIKSDMPIRGFQLRIEFDSTKIDLRPSSLSHIDTKLEIDSYLSGNTIDLLGYFPDYKSHTIDLDNLITLIGWLRPGVDADIPVIFGKTLAVSGENQPLTVKTIPGLVKTKMIPESFRLYQNYPNPFNLETQIEFEISEQVQIQLEIYNIRGGLVREMTLETTGPGKYRVFWNGKNEMEQIVSSGIYIYRLSAGQWHDSKRMLFIQ